MHSFVSAGGTSASGDSGTHSSGLSVPAKLGHLLHLSSVSSLVLAPSPLPARLPCALSPLHASVPWSLPVNKPVIPCQECNPMPKLHLKKPKVRLMGRRYWLPVLAAD
jgi:hypothetical protein